MTSSDRKWFLLAGSAAAGIFCILLLVRVDALDPLFGGAKTLSAAAPLAGEREAWMSIYQGSRKIGFSHACLSPQADGYRLEERVVMRVTSMGLVQELRLLTRAGLAADLAVERFDFEVSSGRFRFSASGERAGGVLRVTTDAGGDRRTTDIPLRNRTYLTAGLFHALAAHDLKPGQRFAFAVFDPSTLVPAEVQAEVVGRDEVQVMGETRAATRISMSLRGMTQTAWIGDNGDLLKERGLLGMRLEKTRREEALESLDTAASDDLTELAAVPSNRLLPDPAGLEALRVRIGGVRTDGLQLKGGRQSFVDGILTVRREDLSGLPDRLSEQDLAPLERAFLKPEPLIQSDHERVVSLAGAILSGADHLSPLARARRLVEWVHRHIEKRPVLSLPDALSTLERRMGDCNEHAVLLAALARAAGIPARLEAGLAYQKGRFYYHAWNQLFVGRWVTADAVFGRLPAEVTHLRLVTGSSQQQLDLAGVIGAVTIEVLDWTAR